MGDFFNLNMFQTPAAVGGAPASAPASASAPSAASGSGVPAGTNTSTGGETFWQNVSNEFLHPVQSGQQLLQLAGAGTPGNAIQKAVALTENLVAEQMTPAQYQLIKYQMAQNLLKAHATPAQVAAAETQLDQYVRVNAGGLAGGYDPAQVPDSKPTVGFSVPWYAWAAGGLALLLVLKR